ncbi:S41 family peptidase [Paraflavitalea sp. CAU 1676]|uniref:S41 family peptidase n=1 Tax=Paraflavitalea sp. CAU 1676 TaxID=3032598 RepID=UPI0023DA4508|nr:S41 family peptidase [Paraflavitalea sp. CAU 1676]MDF2188243.1 S41 family peptidase [Paraflavitalea sp. CAU 1676]
MTCLAGWQALHAQVTPSDSLYSVAHLQEDLAYLKKQVYDVHAFPHTEYNRAQYDQLFNSLQSQITHPLNATAFLRLLKPAIAHLADEHANIGMPQSRLTAALNVQPVFLPFTLEKKGAFYYVADLLAGNHLVKSGQAIAEINGVDINTWIDRCANFASGYADQRAATVVRRFGYYFGWANTRNDTSFSIRLLEGKTYRVAGVDLEAWNVYYDQQAGKTNCTERIRYHQTGNTGFIDACSFDAKKTGPYTLNTIRARIDSIFNVIKETGIKNLVIDVSNNEGGNSAVGDYLIAYINRKPYQDYRSTWKRSAEYQRLYESWGFKNEQYNNTPIGETIQFQPGTVTPPVVPYPFTGKVMVLVGKHTFSSAILFATLIKDNAIAPIAGQEPADGHPNHFGEMYNTKLPHTKIDLRFGVKEWIRPAGKETKDGNRLVPDIILTDKEMLDEKAVIKKALMTRK